MRRGDDPYSILGVSRDATAQQIKSAFRKIAFDHHPDRHKNDKDSYMIWLRANDAYDLLSNPQRKLLFDQYGTVSEAENEENHNTNNFEFTSSQDHFFRQETKVSYYTPLITEQVFPYLARDGSEWILFIFQNFDCPSCNTQQAIWEQLAYDIKDYAKVARLDAAQAPELSDAFGVTSLPLYVSVKLKPNSKYEVHKIGNSFSSKEKALNSIFKFWGASIKKLNSESSFTSWLLHEESKAHVVELHFLSDSTETVSFNYASAKLKQNCVFGSFYVQSSENIKNLFNITAKALPAVLVFRKNDLTMRPIVIEAKGQRLLDEIDEFSSPLFPLLSHFSIDRICSDWCVVHIDSDVNSSINSSIYNEAYTMPFNTGRIMRNSKLGSVITKSNQNVKWVVLSTNKKKFWHVDFSTTNDFVSLCSSLYRADNIEYAMKNKEYETLDTIPIEISELYYHFRLEIRFVVIVLSICIVLFYICRN